MNIDAALQRALRFNALYGVSAKRLRDRIEAAPQPKPNRKQRRVDEAVRALLKKEVPHDG